MIIHGRIEIYEKKRRPISKVECAFSVTRVRGLVLYLLRTSSLAYADPRNYPDNLSLSTLNNTICISRPILFQSQYLCVTSTSFPNQRISTTYNHVQNLCVRSFFLTLSCIPPDNNHGPRLLSPAGSLASRTHLRVARSYVTTKY